MGQSREFVLSAIRRMQKSTVVESGIVPLKLKTAADTLDNNWICGLKHVTALRIELMQEKLVGMIVQDRQTCRQILPESSTPVPYESKSSRCGWPRRIPGPLRRYMATQAVAASVRPAPMGGHQ